MMEGPKPIARELQARDDDCLPCCMQEPDAGSHSTGIAAVGPVYTCMTFYIHAELSRMLRAE